LEKTKSVPNVSKFISFKLLINNPMAPLPREFPLEHPVKRENFRENIEPCCRNTPIAPEPSKLKIYHYAKQ
jgi:hypothetical protein